MCCVYVLAQLTSIFSQVSASNLVWGGTRCNRGSLWKFRRVLIVDDVAMNRKMLKRLFVTRFEECDEAEDGQQAVDMVKEAVASRENYDVSRLISKCPL